MRPGLAEYDLASLLYDPYVTLSADERMQLLEYYGDARSDKSSTAPEILELCAMQRLMQALGAYGFLGLVKGSKSFLQYIGPAIESLHSLIANQPSLKKLERAIAPLLVNR
jgi:aminoglycoside/choline kinase family phosphotransferase